MVDDSLALSGNERNAERRLRWPFSDLEVVGYGNTVEIMHAPLICDPYYQPKGENFAVMASQIRIEGEDAIFTGKVKKDFFSLGFHRVRRDEKDHALIQNILFGHAIPRAMPAQLDHQLVLHPNGEWLYTAAAQATLSTIGREYRTRAQEALLNRQIEQALRDYIHTFNAGEGNHVDAIHLLALSTSLENEIDQATLYLHEKTYIPGDKYDDPFSFFGLFQFDTATDEEAKRQYQNGLEKLEVYSAHALPTTRVRDFFGAFSAFQTAKELAPTDLEIAVHYHAVGMHLARSARDIAFHHLQEEQPPERKKNSEVETLAARHHQREVNKLYEEFCQDKARKERGEELPDTRSAFERGVERVTLKIQRAYELAHGSWGQCCCFLDELI